MDNSENNGLAQTAGTAHAIYGALKTGKAIAATTKGAVIGGPYGAAAGIALWAGQYSRKALAAVVILLALPILFVLMLPSIIFGGLNGSESSSILNNDAAILANTNDLTAAIHEVLGEGIDDVKQRIAQDFDTTDGDNYEVIDPYEDDLISNADLLLAQYCAARTQDWETISSDDLTQLLRQGLSHLYSFTRTSEVREVPADEEDTSEGDPGESDGSDGAPEAGTTTTEKWYIYTIVYNGEAYFADTVFHLTDEQKVLANCYAQNLSLFLGDGSFQGPSSSSEASRTIPSLGSVRFSDGGTEVVYYNQKDERYANAPFGTDNVGDYGCGPSAMAIVVSSLTGDAVDPAEMAEWAYQHGYWCNKSGSYHSLIPGAAEAWGLPVEGCTVSEPQRIVDALSSGKLVVAIMTKGHFTSSGHFIVLRGVQDGKILVADPNSYDRSQRSWDLSIILDEASDHAGAGGPFWIIG